LVLGNMEARSSATMNSLFALSTSAGHFGVEAGGLMIANYGNERGNIYINSNYSGTGATNVILQPFDGSVGIGATTLDPLSRLHSFGRDSSSGSGGVGVRGHGGNSSIVNGGVGVLADGGNGSIAGGIGIVAEGGLSFGGTRALAGLFQNGNVQVNGGLTAGSLNVQGTKNFKIDHPLDPENKYLYHAAIESSEVLNVYSGNAVADQNGAAVVTLPDWFEAINCDFRYQLTVVGVFAQAIVAEKIRHNRFVIRTNAPNVEVSWQVTGVRSDQGMRKHPFKVEEEKPERERGYYLQPEVFGHPEEKGVDWARNPELMRQLKETRLKQIEEMKQKKSKQ